MSNHDTPPVCRALTKAGQPCSLLAVPGSEFCAVHQPIPEPPPYSRGRLVALIEQLFGHLPKGVQTEALGRLETFMKQDMVDPEFWRGTWYMLNYTLKYQADLIRRRYTGEYETDDWGLDWEFVDAMRPVFALLYRLYWRVHTSGVDNLPVEGRALLMANRSGLFPWDGTMIATAVLTEHPAGRLVRVLYGSSAAATPFLSSALVRLGGAPATLDDGVRLLENGELVLAFTEGHSGAVKSSFGMAHAHPGGVLQSGRSDLVKMAVKTQAPIIPVAVAGAAGSYAGANRFSVGHLPPAIRHLPIRWTIDFGRPIFTDAYGSQAAENNVLVSQFADRVRNTVQEMLRFRPAQRRPARSG